MKLCIDCKYHAIDESKDHSWITSHIYTQRTAISPVDGHIITGECVWLRSDGECGPKGKLWEPKEIPKLSK